MPGGTCAGRGGEIEMGRRGSDLGAGPLFSSPPSSQSRRELERRRKMRNSREVDHAVHLYRWGERGRPRETYAHERHVTLGLPNQRSTRRRTGRRVGLDAPPNPAGSGRRNLGSKGLSLMVMLVGCLMGTGVPDPKKEGVNAI